ncbi:hypothetical protein Tco_0558022 [Tanacetum coccineum]
MGVLQSSIVLTVFQSGLGVLGLGGRVNQSEFGIFGLGSTCDWSAGADLPVLEDLDGCLLLVDSLGVEDFFEDSASFPILLFFDSLPWFGPTGGSSS